MINDQDFSLLELYLDGTLTEDSKITFEVRLQNEEDLRNYLSFMIETDKALETFDKEQKIEEWKEIIQSEVGEEDMDIAQPAIVRQLSTVYRSNTARYVMSIAAMMMLFVAIYLMVPSSSTAPDQLASVYWNKTAHFSPDTNRGATPQPIESTIEKIYELHEQGEYAAALNGIKQLAAPDEKTTLLKGSCYYHIGEMDNAIQTFQQIVQLENSYAEDEAKWYLALSYLSKGDVAKGQKELEEIAVQNLWNHQFAAKLLKEIR